MVTPWRIQLQNIDKSQTTTAPVGTVGAMVIRASRGPVTPIYISAGDEARILKLYGKPSADYPDVWEAIQFNRGYGIWLSAPYMATDTYGTGLLKSTGSASVTGGLTEAQVDGYTFAAVTDYALITTKSPANNYKLAIKTTYDTVNKVFVTVVAQNVNGSWVPKETLRYSFTPGAKDGYGKIVYYENIFSQSDLVLCLKNPNMEAATPIFVDDTAFVELTGSDRSGTLTGVEIAAAWTQFQNVNKYPFQIAMDNTSFDVIPTTFETLRQNYQTFSDYLYPVAMGVSGSDAITARLATGPDESGLKMYINHFATVDTYNGGYFWTSWIGRVGYKYAVMDDVFNGLAPMWIDDSQGHGGQLGSGVASAGSEWDFSEDQLQLLDAASINPIVIDPNFGVMIKSQKTMKSPASTSDYNYVDRVRLFDYIKKTIIEQVLVYYIGKKNNATIRNEARGRGEQILAPILGRGLLDQFIVKCDEENNNANVLAESKLVYEIGVRVVPSAEMIMFNFVNAGQTITVTEAIAGGNE